MYFSVVQQPEASNRANNVRDSLAAEWESFEKLIETSNDEQFRAAETEQDSGSMSSSDRLKKPATVTTSQSFASKSEVRQKRLFREVQSDSDGNGSSDSEDVSRPILPAIGVNSGIDNKTDRHSTSTDSSPHAENKPRTKPASSDSDSSSDDEKHTEQTKLPLGKYEMLVVCVHVNDLVYGSVSFLFIRNHLSLPSLKIFVKSLCY